MGHKKTVGKNKVIKLCLTNSNYCNTLEAGPVSIFKALRL
jgi:hypothetical protein